MRILLFTLWFVAGISHAEINLLVRASAVAQSDETSFQSWGVSHQRFDNNDIALSQALLSFDTLVTDDWYIHGVFNGYSDGEEKLGFTQLYAKYRPLTANKIKPEVKVGFFYPAMSVENTDIGWLSTHFLSNSAINSWIGEELRTAGIEVSFRKNGRQTRSPWSWKVVGSLYKGNDTTGTLLAWRGFALHDRQSIHDDRINFPPIPGVVNDNGIDAPAWTDPFREIDTNIGFYLGGHLAYKRDTDLRYYYYDNRANPLIVDPDRIYAWQTRFHSLAIRHRISPELTLLSQGLMGSTKMGYDIVDNDFYAAYAALIYTQQSHTYSARLDWYQVVDNDSFMYDPNASRGEALSLHYEYKINDRLSVATEWQTNRGRKANRRFFVTRENYIENSLQLALTFRY